MPNRRPASRAKKRSALFLTAISVVGVQLLPAAAVADPEVPTSGGGTCWGPTRWCPVQWTGSPGVGAEMKFDFNNYTNKGCAWATPDLSGCTQSGCTPGPGCSYANETRPDWDDGIAAAAGDWASRRDHNNVEHRDLSPIAWAWTTSSNSMPVGFYHTTSGTTGVGYVAQVQLYWDYGPNTFTDSCGSLLDVVQARVRINKTMIDGTPTWFYNALLRHELGHVFGLCHARNEQVQPDYKKSVMYAPKPHDINGCPNGPYFYEEPSCFTANKDTAADGANWAPDAPWSRVPGADPDEPYSVVDYSSPSCPGVNQGVRCVYGE